MSLMRSHEHATNLSEEGDFANKLLGKFGKELLRSVSSLSGATWAFGTSSTGQTGPPECAWKISVAGPQRVLELTHDSHDPDT